MIDVEGFEGPLDLLLTLARQQKVDLAKISILALADQYLAFIEEARKLRLELAADYLVMAAWLAYLKSRLLLPEPPEPDGLSAEDMANRARPAPAPARSDPHRGRAAAQSPAAWSRSCLARRARSRSPTSSGRNGSATLYDLLSAYAAQRQKQRAGACARAQAHRLVARRGARGAGAAHRRGRGLESARSIIFSPMWSSPSLRATVLASSFAATLELVREGAP